MTTRKSSKRPTARRSRTPAGRTAAQKLWIALVAVAAIGVCVYPPWSDVWTNFEGFRMQAPLVYAFLWSPPPPVFPVARAVDAVRLGEELGVVGAIGVVVYWLLGKRHGGR